MLESFHLSTVDAALLLALTAVTVLVILLLNGCNCLMHLGPPGVRIGGGVSDDRTVQIKTSRAVKLIGRSSDGLALEVRQKSE